MTSCGRGAVRGTMGEAPVTDEERLTGGGGLLGSEPRRSDNKPPGPDGRPETEESFIS